MVSVAIRKRETERRGWRPEVGRERENWLFLHKLASLLYSGKFSQCTVALQALPHLVSTVWSLCVS